MQYKMSDAFTFIRQVPKLFMLLNWFSFFLSLLKFLEVLIDWLINLIQVLDHLKWDKCYIVGHSLGNSLDFEILLEYEYRNVSGYRKST